MVSSAGLLVGLPKTSKRQETRASVAPALKGQQCQH